MLGFCDLYISSKLSAATSIFMFLAPSSDKNSQSKQLVSELQRCWKKQSTTFPAFEVPWIAASPANSFYSTSPGLFGWPSDPSQSFCSTREGQIHRFPLSPCSLPRLLRIPAFFLLKDFNKFTFSSIGRVMKINTERGFPSVSPYEHHRKTSVQIQLLKNTSAICLVSPFQSAPSKGSLQAQTAWQLQQSFFFPQNTLRMCFQIKTGSLCQPKTD